MTPEEKAVIEAAVDWHHLWERRPGGNHAALYDTVRALIYSCPECNAGGHTCPGDGNPIGHTASDCGEHDDPRQAVVDGSTFPCWECLTDPTEDPAPWCDCRREDFGGQNPGHPCRLRAHSPDRCLNRPPTSVKVVQVRADDPAWVTSTMTNVLINDRIRLGTDEATVLRSNRGIWNVDTRDYWQPKAFRHEEFRMALDVLPEFKQYPATLAVEILCTPERLAVLRIQEGFPGSAIVS